MRKVDEESKMRINSERYGEKVARKGVFLRNTLRVGRNAAGAMGEVHEKGEKQLLSL